MRAFIRMALALLESARERGDWDDVLDLGCDCVELDDWRGEWT